MLRYGGVEDVRLDVVTSTALITFNDVERAKKLVGAAAHTRARFQRPMRRCAEAHAPAARSEDYDEGVGAPVLVAETPVRVQWASPPAAAGGDGAAVDGAMLPGSAFSSKHEQLDYAVVRPSRASPPVAPRALAALTPRLRSALRWPPIRTSAMRRRRSRRGWRTASSSRTKTSDDDGARVHRACVGGITSKTPEDGSALRRASRRVTRSVVGARLGMTVSGCGLAHAPPQCRRPGRVAAAPAARVSCLTRSAGRSRPRGRCRRQPCGGCGWCPATSQSPPRRA